MSMKLPLVCLTILATGLQSVACADKRSQAGNDTMVRATMEEYSRAMDECVDLIHFKKEPEIGFHLLVNAPDICGRAFQAAGTAFKLMSTLPQSELSENTFITEWFKRRSWGWQRYNGQAGFDQYIYISAAYRDIIDAYALHGALETYSRGLNELDAMVRRRMRIFQPNDLGFADFQNECKRTDMGLTILKHTVQVANDTLQRHVSWSAYNAVKHHLRSLAVWSRGVFSDVIEAADIRHACLGAEGHSDEYLGGRVEETKETIEKFWIIVQDAVQNLKLDFGSQIEADANMLVRKYGTIHNRAFTDRVYEFLNTKYHWGPKWLVVSFKPDTPESEGGVYYDCIGKTCAHVKYDFQGTYWHLFIAWCDMKKPLKLYYGLPQHETGFTRHNYKKMKEWILWKVASYQKDKCWPDVFRGRADKVKTWVEALAEVLVRVRRGRLVLSRKSDDARLQKIEVAGGGEDCFVLSDNYCAYRFFHFYIVYVI